MALVALTLSSCKKENVDDAVNSEVTTANDSEEGESVTNEATNIADAAYHGSKLFGRYSSVESPLDALSSCATITNDTVASPHVLTIDFGSTNCTCNDGKTRRGQIIVTYTGGYFTQGSIKTMTFDNFYRNDNKIEGTRTITNLGENVAVHPNWSISAVNMKITRVNGDFHTWNSERNREMTAGFNTASWSDDQYVITGSASGTNINGIGYTANIITPLHRSLSCNWIDSGVISITKSNGAARNLDFGSGNCDNQALLTITRPNGNTGTRTVTLH